MSDCYKINLAISGFPHIDSISPSAEFQIYDIFKAGSNAVCVIAENTVSQGNIGQIEFFLRFQDFLPLQVISGTAVKQICLFQLFQIAVNRFVVEGSPFCFQVICNGLGGKGVADIIECVFYDTLQLVDLPNLISLYNIREDRGIVYIPDNRVDFILRIRLQMRCRKSSQANIIGKFCFRLPNIGEFAFEHQIFAKRQGKNAEGNVSASKIGRYFRGHHSGVGACNIQVNIKIGCQ